MSHWCHQADRPITAGDVGKLIVISGHGYTLGTVTAARGGLEVQIQDPMSARRRSIAARTVTHYTLLDTPDTRPASLQASA
jgi:hypothetical protein